LSLAAFSRARLETAPMLTIRRIAWEYFRPALLDDQNRSAFVLTEVAGAR